METSQEILVKALEIAHDEYIDAKQYYTRCLETLQAVCDHKLVSETPYICGTIWSDRYVEMRICETCGIEEERDGGWKILKTDRPKIVSRDELYSLRRDIY